MPSTSRGFRYPAAGDAPDGPTQIHNLASDIQDELDGTLPVGGLTVTNNATVGGDLTVSDDIACDDISVGDDATVGGDLAVNGTLTIGGVSVAANTRGKSIIATAESRTNTAYGTLTTPDQVAGIVLPTDGVIRVLYQAQWKELFLGTARAALFVGANQITAQRPTAAAPEVQAAKQSTSAGTSDTYVPLVSFPGGLATSSNGGGATGSDVTTGQVVGLAQHGGTPPLSFEVGSTALTPTGFVGGAAVIFAAAGTYTISVQFKSSSGSVTAKDRHLWVEAVGF